MKLLKERLFNIFVKSIEENGRITQEEFVNKAYLELPKMIGLYQVELGKKGITKIFKEILRQYDFYDTTDDPHQLQIFGEAYTLPRMISIATNKYGISSFEYVEIRLATWSDLESHREIKQKNIQRAAKKFEDYEKFMRIVEPYMVNDKNLKVNDVISKIAV
jgi:hypothetical protein